MLVDLIRSFREKKTRRLEAAEEENRKLAEQNRK